MATFGERLRQLRKEKDMKQEDVAKLVGVSLNTVSLWERDVREPDTTHNLKELRI